MRVCSFALVMWATLPGCQSVSWLGGDGGNSKPVVAFVPGDTDAPTDDTDDTDPSTLKYTPDWDGVVAMADHSCVSCHIQGGTALGLPFPVAIQIDLDRGTGDLVVPFDPEGSTYWRVLIGELGPDDIADMPLDLPLLPMNEVDHIRLWILAGAPYPPLPRDLDQDGHDSFADGGGDCDDVDPLIHPDAIEICNNLDDDCDGSVDEALGQIWYDDVDGDGYGDDATAVESCVVIGGRINEGGDCADLDAFTNPGADELCDGRDNNCDGIADGFDALDIALWFIDDDSDGYGVIDGFAVGCEAPSGYVGNLDDCDDTRGDVHPGAAEGNCSDPTDYNCDGVTGFVDGDGDGVAACVDCADNNADAYPGAPEICDGIDNDCNTLVDDGLDADGDGYTSCAGDCDDTDPAINPAAIESCGALVDLNCDGGVGFVDNDGDGSPACDDCNDGNPDAYPGAFEACDGVDNNCDAVIDEGFNVDGDGFTSCGGDCDDSDPAIYPGSPEPDCTDPTDYNCDGSVAYFDGDGDGSATCVDCNDGNASIFPGAPEVCDGVDQSCDGLVDEGFDTDGDGFSTCMGDCNDNRFDTHPGAPEIWYDGIDQNCAGGSDFDQDGDGYTVIGAPAGTADDCDDTRANIHVGVAVDGVDGLDNDCDGLIDEGPFGVDFGTDVEPILTANCTNTQCHDGFMPAQGMNLTAGNAYANVVGVISAQNAPMPLITPSDTFNSYLLHKILGTHLAVGGSGTEMPKTPSPPLTQGELDLLTLWVTEGANP